MSSDATKEHGSFNSKPERGPGNKNTLVPAGESASVQQSCNAMAQEQATRCIYKDFKLIELQIASHMPLLRKVEAFRQTVLKHLAPSANFQPEACAKYPAISNIAIMS